MSIDVECLWFMLVVSIRVWIYFTRLIPAPVGNWQSLPFLFLILHGIILRYKRVDIPHPAPLHTAKSLRQSCFCPPGTKRQSCRAGHADEVEVIENSADASRPARHAGDGVSTNPVGNHRHRRKRNRVSTKS